MITSKERLTIEKRPGTPAGGKHNKEEAHDNNSTNNMANSSDIHHSTRLGAVRCNVEDVEAAGIC